MQASDALLLGRTTYDIFRRYWPGQTDEIGLAFDSVPKYVASRGTPELSWADSTQLTDAGAEVRDLRERHEQIHTWGSADLLQTLFREGLVDQVNLWVCPVVIGQGKKLSPTAPPPAGSSCRAAEGVPRRGDAAALPVPRGPAGDADRLGARGFLREPRALDHVTPEQLGRGQQPAFRRPGHAHLTMRAGVHDPQVPLAAVGLPGLNPSAGTTATPRPAATKPRTTARSSDSNAVRGVKPPARHRSSVCMRSSQEGRSITKSSSATSSRLTSERSARRWSNDTARTSGCVNKRSQPPPPRAVGGR